MTRRAGTSKSLRRRLFVSHLLVIGVALAVLVAGFGLVLGALELLGERKAFGRSGPDDGGPAGLMFGLAAAATASAIVSWRVSRRIAEPLEVIGEGTRRLAAGSYDVRLPPADTIEVTALANDVNQLAEQLESTEQRRLRLIGDVAHELRNPLSTIEGTMEALLDGVVEPGDDTFARIGREAARLRRLADDLSSLSAAGELTDLKTGPLDLVQIATHVVGQLEPQATAKGLVLQIEHADEVAIDGDRDRLTQALTNVIGNAVQYTNEGRIDVRVSADASYGYVDVADTGRGLSAEDQARIFERFYRVDEQLTDGTGVGLAIARMIVAAHDGEIQVTSMGPGNGSTFRIVLPRR